MTIVRGAGARHEAEHIWFNGALVSIQVAGRDSDGTFHLAEVRAWRGHRTPLHTDANCETFHLLEGEMLFHIDGRKVLLAAGDTVVLPKGVPHAFLVTSPLVRYLVLNVPAGQERLFRAGGDPAAGEGLPPPGPPDFERIAAAARRLDVDILGPPPFPPDGPAAAWGGSS